MHFYGKAPDKVIVFGKNKTMNGNDFITKHCAIIDSGKFYEKQSNEKD